MVLTMELARGLAALWVVFFHLGSLFDSSSFIYFLSSYGSLGVSMFFVISGYVITFSAESNRNNNKSPLGFIKNRFMRIYPTFWASIILLCVLPYVIELTSSFKTGIYSAPVSLLDSYSYEEWFRFVTLTKVFFAQSDDLQAQFNAVNSVYWTLAIEFQFYVTVFVALYFGRYFRHVIVLVSIVSFWALLTNPSLNHGLFIRFWPEFSVGIVLAYLHKCGYLFSSMSTAKSILWASFVLLFVLFLYSATHVVTKGLTFSILFGVLLWLGAGIEDALIKLKRSNLKMLNWLVEPWLLLGAMSYSVYLLHGKIYLIPFMFVRQVIDQGSNQHGILVIFGTLLLCYPFYYLIERRFLSMNYKAIQKRALTYS